MEVARFAFCFCQQGSQVLLIHIATKHGDFTVTHRFVKVHCNNFGNSSRFVQNTLVVRWDDLAAIAPVSLEAIIGWWVVASADDDARNSTKLANGKA